MKTPALVRRRKPLVTLHLGNQKDSLGYFAAKGVSPGVMLWAHFIDKLPAILKSSAWIGVACVAAFKFWK